MNKKVFFLMMILPALIVSSCNTDSEDPNADLARDMKAIDAYLASTGVPDEKIIYDNATGVRFVFDTYGQGIAPTTGQTLTYDVIGSVLSGGTTGFPFTNTIETKKIDDIVPEGLNFGLRSILQGTKVAVYVPARYGYGSSGNSTLGIPADAILRYDLDLQTVARTSTQQTRFQQDTLTIKNFVIFNEIENAVMHESGIWYTVDVQGSGKVPTPYSAVNFDYKLRSLADPDVLIETGNLEQNFVWGLVQGLRIGFQLMQEGDTFTFYLPSGMCYGPNGNGTIPANANLIFEIKLKTVAN